MNDLDRLAESYDALVATDGGGFRRRARVLQSIWRSKQGYGVGTHSARRGTRPSGSRLPMPWAEETLANYLSDTVRQVVRCEVLDPEKSRGKLYARPRIFNDLLSSQPLCFNLFGELQQDLTLATGVLADLTSGRVGRVTAIEFEYSPGRGDVRYTGDRSAFDAYVVYWTPEGGRGFAGIEVKYHENLLGGSARHRARYDEVAATMGCFREERRGDLRRQPVQQVWRDHLLAGSHRHVDGFDDGFFAFVYPRGNGHCAAAMRAYRECLSECDSFVEWTLEDVCTAIRRHTDGEWIERFVDRYLAFEKLARAGKLVGALREAPYS